jgi:uncharacterized protein
MPELFKTPGVYVKEIAKLPPSIAPVETAIPAFIGYTEKAEDILADDLHLKPKRITSMLEYRTFFGEPQKETGITVEITTLPDGSVKRLAKLDESRRSSHVMNYSLEMFFANGGGPCYIVSVGDYLKLPPTPDIPAPGPAPASITPAPDPLVGALKAGLDVLVKEDEPTLIVFPEAQRLGIAEFKVLHDAALTQCSKLGDRFVIMDVHGGVKGTENVSLSNPKTNILDAVNNFRNGGIGANLLNYGAAYGPNIDTVLDYSYNDADVIVKLTPDPDPTVALPSSLTKKMQELRLNPTQVGANYSKNLSWAYEAAKAAIRELPMKLPPSSAIAGVYAATDSSLGVWRAPANFSINNVTQPSIQITDEQHADLNVDVNGGKSVNAIRNFQGKGPMIWGARTLAGNDNEWRYVNVRRFFIFVEESTKKAAMQFTFASNDANTWVKLQGMIENFLTTLWRQGALQGVKPEHAFYVAVGLNKTMTSLDILEGRLIVEIGMAAVRPAEFIVLRFSHMLAQS